MTIKAPFTQATLRRAIRVAQEAGLRIAEIKIDGTIVVEGSLTYLDTRKAPKGVQWKNVGRTE